MHMSINSPTSAEQLKLLGRQPVFCTQQYQESLRTQQVNKISMCDARIGSRLAQGVRETNVLNNRLYWAVAGLASEERHDLLATWLLAIMW
jgi:hypothetical protein